MRKLLTILTSTVPLLLPASAHRGMPAAAPLDAPAQAASDALDRRWRENAARLLVDPTRIVPPFSDRGTFFAHEAEGRAYVFSALEGQTLDIEFARAAVIESDYDDGPIVIDLYRVAWHGARQRLVRVDAIRLDSGLLSARLPRTADYILRIQPGLLSNAHFGLRLELSAALEFPVPGANLAAVRSFYGDDRDGGTRLHEGVDIYAPRSTPIVAVADGRAVPKRDKFGGNVVYLNTPGVSYYYAHLEHAAIERPRRVRAGDVLGFIGNSGNAARTPPHLHFGIYDWGRGQGAVDPLPHLVAQRFDEPFDVALPPAAEQVSSNDRLEPSMRGDIVWMPAPASVPTLVSSDVRPWLQIASPLDAIEDLALAQRRPNPSDVFLSGDTAARHRGTALQFQLQYGLRP